MTRGACVPFSEADPQPRILVTGGAGFVGGHLVERLVQMHGSAMTLKVVDNLWRGQLDNLIDMPTGQRLINFKTNVCIGDLTDYGTAAARLKCCPLCKQRHKPRPGFAKGS